MRVDVFGGFNLDLICMNVASAKQQLVEAMNSSSDTVFLVAEIRNWGGGERERDSNMNQPFQIVIWQTGIGERFLFLDPK